MNSKSTRFIPGDVIAEAERRNSSHKKKNHAGHAAAVFAGDKGNLSLPFRGVVRPTHSPQRTFIKGDYCMAADKATGLCSYCVIKRVDMESFNGGPLRPVYTVEAALSRKVWTTPFVSPVGAGGYGG